MMTLLAQLVQAHKARHERFFPDPNKPKPEPPKFEKLPDVVNVAKIIRVVSRKTGISKDQILANGRQQRIVMPRQIIMYLAYRMTKSSYPQVGTRLHRHHTSVMSGETRIARLRAISPDMDRVLTELETEILSQEQT